MRKTRRWSILLLFFTLFGNPEALGGETFFYKPQTGDKYRIISRVYEEVYVNRRFSHSAEIVNRIAAEVQGIRDGIARHKAVFQTAERAVGTKEGRSFQWDREYPSEFGRNPQGYITIEPQYFMPVVRNVPVFPARDLKPEDTWSAQASEVHDFRESLGIAEPYRIPFVAHYTFLGNREWQGTAYPAFSVSYDFFVEPGEVFGDSYPIRIMGASSQVLYWDRALNQAAAYEEQFRMVFTLSNGVTIEYRGRAEAEVVESKTMDKEHIAEEIAEDISRLGIGDVSVRVTEEGIAISLEDIQFQPDSAVLLREEQHKLDTIAAILKRYQDRDILVGGHTALAGSAGGRMQLSRERARAVADYLIRQEVRGADRVVVRGYGAERPIADNRTDAGRHRNRRVEITLLEN
ncbi:MAG: OmpA family protein [Treponema sp.]|jgi:outer membrane protein OmpA-like peptidoglycan-associated protein|nr:OmpA family protein [Treponema sp.]